MNDVLDDRIRRLMREIDDAAPAPRPWARITGARPAAAVRRSIPLIAVPAAAVALVVAVLVLPGNDDTRVVTVPPGSTSPDSTAPSVTSVPSPTAGPSVGGGLLTAEHAAEIAGAGNDDVRALFASVPAEATYEVQECSTGEDAGCRPADPDSPGAAELAVELTYLDLATLIDILGVDPAAVAGGLEPQRWLPPDAPLLPVSIPPFFGGSDDPAAQRAEVGFTFGDIERILHGRRIPNESAVLDVAVPPDVIDAAVRADPTWSAALRVVEDAGTTFYDWTGDGEPFSQDLARASPMRPLGVGGQLHAAPSVSGSRVSRTLDPAVMQAAIDDDPASALTAGPYASGLAMALLPDARLVQLIARPAEMNPPQQDNSGPSVSGMVAKIVAVSVDVDGLRTDTYVIFETSTAAADNVEAITTLLGSARPTGDQSPTSNTMPPEADVTRTANIVQVTTRGFNTGAATPVAES